MKVYFIGAGPGAADLITVRGAKLLSQIKVVLYAGSLVPLSVLEHCHKDAIVHNTAELSLEQQVAYFEDAIKRGEDVARVHSGDPAIYGATAEQMHRLDLLGIDYEVVPGVSSFSAAAATIKRELTKPDVSQTVILTRVSGRASKVPETESIEYLARHKATMCIFLSGPHLKQIVDDLLKHYPEATPVSLVYRASWPDERVHNSTLGAILSETEVKDWKLTTMMLVGDVLKKGVTSTSRLYAQEYSHLFRAGLKAETVCD
ncbi:MAG: precorrin-4 C(11)-methyltransferase [Candidatus Obscuribacterales bacterium]|nr:precorrin-4 C(11)-methyltransferase [Candidatus Obscuribacterales bacterium]